MAASVPLLRWPVAGAAGATALARTGLDLPVEAVGAGFLLGAWGLYHLRRTGQEGPLPLRPVLEDAPDDA